MFLMEPRLRLVVPVEGTRAYNHFWRSVFYFIAKGASGPSLTKFLDYSKKTRGFCANIHVTEHIKADMNKLRAFYATVTGKFPSCSSIIRLKEET